MSDLDKYSIGRYEQLEKAHVELVKTLKPFANFACSPKNECKCNNCVARDLADKYEVKDV